MSGFPYYSDNMYSGLDDSDSEEQEDLYAAHAGLGLGGSSYVPGGMGRHRPEEEEEEEEEVVLSPSDGYFGHSSPPTTAAATTSTTSFGTALGSNNDPSHASSYHAPGPQQQAFATPSVPPGTTSPPASVPASSQVPHVPDVWVSDPSLEQGSTAESKAREAQRERDQNRRLFAPDADRMNSHYYPPSQNLGHPQPHAYSPPSATTASASQPTSTYNSHPPPPPRDGNNSSSAFSLLNPQQPLHANTNLPYPSGSVAGGPSSSTTPNRAGHNRYAPPSSSFAPPGGAAAPAPSSSSSSRPRRSATIYSERSSLFSEAPPAYTPSPTSPTSGGSSSPPTSHAGYQTFPPSSFTTPSQQQQQQQQQHYHHHHQQHNMGRLSESESHGLLAGQTYQSIPENMGGQPDEEGHYRYPQPTGWKDRIRAFDWRKHWKLIALGVVLTFVTIGFLVSSVFGVKNSKTIKFPGGNTDNSPVERPDVPAVGDDGTRLAYPPFDRDMQLPEMLCGNDNIKYSDTTIKLEMGEGRNLTIVQDIQDRPSNGRDIHVRGDVVLRRSGAGTPGPSIVIETTSNDAGIELEMHWDWQSQRLDLLTPRAVPRDVSRPSSPCVSVRVTVWAPPAAALDTLDVQAVHLGVKLLDNLSLRLGRYARLASTVGAVVAATDGEKDTARLMREPPPPTFGLDARFVEVKTLSSSIEGSWPLYDYLGLETISGSVRAGVSPKDALKEKPLPAILYAKSTSGHLEIYEPVAEAVATFALLQQQQQQQQAGGVLVATAEALIPPRAYGVDIHTMSGHVKAAVAFTHSCKVHTTSGRVDLTLLPVLDATAAAAGGGGDYSSFIETGTTSGTTAVGVLDALWTDIDAGKLVSAPLAVPPPPPAPLPVRDSDPYDVLEPPPSPVVAASARAAAQPLLRVLSGRHAATSASIRVTYPSAWEGSIDADSLSGSIDVGGEGVEIIRRGDGFPGGVKKHVLAKKGPDGVGGAVRVHTTSGSIGVRVGR